MCRNVITVALLGAFILTAGTALAGEPQVYGKGVSAQDTILVSQILDNPDNFVGKVVRVAGTAVGVCKHRGCWVEIASDRETETIRLKVKDGEIVFPPELIGDQILAEGVFTANKLDLETSKKVCEMEAKKAGEDFDPTKVTQCVTLYQITGTGAVVLVSEKVETGEDPHDHDHGKAHGHDHGGH